MKSFLRTQAAPMPLTLPTAPERQRELAAVPKSRGCILAVGKDSIEDVLKKARRMAKEREESR